MRRQRRGIKLLALILGLSLFAAACGGDDDEASSDDESTDEGSGGGEFIDMGTFVGDQPEHIDPALNVTLDAYQVVNALYDGLTEVDASDPDAPEVRPLVAESYESNTDATVWTFQIREGLKFSDGTDVLPSSFQRAWERASDPDFAGDYSYLMNFIEGGAEKLEGTADSLAGVEVDDEAMTLTVTLAAPYSTFDAVAGFQLFAPMPEAVDELDDQNDWENGLMIGNGPFVLAEERTDEEIVLEPNDEWDGTLYDEAFDLPESPSLGRLIFRTVDDPDTSLNSFIAGEADNANVPPGRVSEVESYGNTLDVAVLGSYHYEIKWDNPVVGGPQNLKLRQAISQAIDREKISEDAWDGVRTPSAGITPPGMPGYKENICEFCTYDPAAAQAAYDEWKAAGNSLTEPIKIQINTGAGHEPVVDIIIENLDTIGIPAERQDMATEDYFTQLTDGACVICRSGWYADYPTYDNFMYDLFHSDAIGGNNHGFYSNPEFDALVDQAKATVDKDEQAALFNQAEDILLNQDLAVLPLLVYKGDYAYDADQWDGFTLNNLGLIPWEKVTEK